MRRGRKGARKSTQEEVKQEVKREIRRSTNAMIQDMMGADMSNIAPSQIAQLRQQLKQHQNRGVNIGYLKTVLFPEQFTYDIPLPLSSISYCKFTDKQEMTINTGPLGQGVIIWQPRVNGGPQLFYYVADSGVTSSTDPYRYSKTLPLTSGIPIADGATATSINDGYFAYTGASTTSFIKYWRVGLPTYAFQNFTQTAIVGASLSVQYVGKVESESGLLVGGHVYGVPVENLVLDDIENSQWVTRARPGEGLRFLFLPKDQTDYEFYPCTSGQAYPQGAAPSSEKNTVNLKARAPTNQTSTSAGGTGAFMGLSGAATWLSTDSVIADPLQIADATITYQKNTNFVAIYWTGMEPNKDWLRLDAIRKFCGIPTQKARDIVELTRPMKTFDANKTFGVLNMLCNTSPIGGHTLKEVDRVIDNLMEVLPNAGYVLDNGGIGQVRTLDELVDVLSNPVERSKQLEGGLQGSTKRMYKYFL